MKVLQINATYGYGSTGKNVQEQHEYFLSKGIDSYVAYGIIGDNNERIFQIGSVFDHKIHALMSRITGKQGEFSLAATRKLLSKIDQIKPDIVHLHNLHSNYIHLPTLLEYLGEKDIATVLTLHDFWFFTGRCYHYLYDKCDRYKENCGKCPYLKRERAWFDYSAQMLKEKRKLLLNIKRLGVVGVSKWTLDEAETSFLQAVNKKTYIHNWVDTNVFYPRENTKKSNKKTVVAVCQGWSDIKGLPQAIALANELGEDVEIRLIGNMIGNHNLPKNVTAIGYTKNDDELADYYSQADCFVNFSTVETFGKVVIEALACGTPAVVFASTALREIVTEDCGKTVEVNDIKAMAYAVKEIFEKGKKYYTQRCVSLVREKYCYSLQVEKYLEFYKRVQND